MKQLLKMTTNITNDIQKEFESSKCKILHIEKGRWKNANAESTLNIDLLETLKQVEVYII